MSGRATRCCSFPLARASTRTLLAAVLAAALGLSGRVPAAPEPSADDAVKAPNDFAGVYLDRYVPADKALDLTPQGRNKSQAYANYYLGLLKEQSGDWNGAIVFYRRVLNDDPAVTGLANRAAYIAAQNGDVETGLEILRHSLETNPEEPDCYLALSRFYASYLDNPEDAKREATRVASEALEKFPGDPHIIEHVVLTHIGFDEKATAEEILDNALESKSKDPFYWLRMGRVAQHVWPMPGRTQPPPERLNAIYEKALQLDPEDLRIAEAVGDYYNASSQYDAAADVYTAIIDKDPDCVTPREKLARIFAVRRETDKVIEVLSALLEQHPNRPNTQRFLARIYEEEKEDYAKAIDHYELSLRLVKGEVSDYLHTAVLMLLPPPINRVQDAVDLLERARFHYPENGDVTRLLGISYAFNDEYGKAIDTFEDTIRLGAQAGAQFVDHELFFRYGACRERLKQFDKAAELFQKAITLVPEEEPARAARIYNYLGYMWLDLDMNIAEAGELIIKANELKPDDGAFIDSLGWFHFKSQNYEEALKQLLRAEELLGEEFADGVILDHIAQTHFALGNRAEAIAYSEKAVAKALAVAAEKGEDPDDETKAFQKRLEEYRAAPAEKPAGE